MFRPRYLGTSLLRHIDRHLVVAFVVLEESVRIRSIGGCWSIGTMVSSTGSVPADVDTPFLGYNMCKSDVVCVKVMLFV